MAPPLNPRAQPFYFSPREPQPILRYPHRTYNYEPLKPTGAFLDGNVKPFHWWFCNRRNLPPRLLKTPKKVRVSSKNQNFSANPLPPPAEEEDKVLAGKTSLMVRNIPNQLRRIDLLRILDSHCRKENEKAEKQNLSSSAAYDFLYLPMDFKRRANLGYAFVNFTSSVAAVRFKRDFHNFSWTIPGNKKICQITVAKYQGKEELSGHFKCSRFACHSDDYLPVILSPASDGFKIYRLTNLGQRVGLRSGRV